MGFLNFSDLARDAADDAATLLGLLCHLLGLDAARLLADDLMTGAALECFVAAELTKQISWSETRPGLSHYRTHTQ